MDKVLKTRIGLKYDTLDNWIASNITLRPGEIAIVVDKLEAPTSVMIKSGDGGTPFQDLPYISHPIDELQAEIAEAVAKEFDDRFNEGLILYCGGVNPIVEPPTPLTEEAINEAVNNVLTDILNTEY